MIEKLAIKLKNFRKVRIRHDNLKKLMKRITEDEDYSQETTLRFFNELKHSKLILSGKPSDNWGVHPAVVDICCGKLGLLFTDMDEFIKAFPDMKYQPYDHPFSEYLITLDNKDLDGFIINIEGEFFLLNKELTDLMNPLPERPLLIEKDYTPSELKELKDSIDNSSLEEFINDPSNIGNYKNLFDEISSSMMQILAISVDDYADIADEGVISLERKPLVMEYMEESDGFYSLVFTSNEKFENVQTPFNRYSQIINFWEFVSSILEYNGDGIIINPNSEHFLIKRDVLVQYSDYIKEKCDDKRLNSAMLNIFLMEA